MNTSQLTTWRRFRKRIRFVGVWFIVVGGFMLYPLVGILLDPEATIIYNGVPTNDYSIKLGATIFCGSFFLFGIFAALAPTKLLHKLFVFKRSLKYGSRRKK